MHDGPYRFVVQVAFVAAGGNKKSAVAEAISAVRDNRPVDKTTLPAARVRSVAIFYCSVFLADLLGSNCIPQL